MTNFSDEPSHDGGLDPVERALARALADRVGGSLAAATTVEVDESRLVAMEAAIEAAPGPGVGGIGPLGRRRGALLLTAAAAVVAALFLAVALSRNAQDSTEVRLGGDPGTPLDRPPLAATDPATDGSVAEGGALPGEDPVSTESTVSAPSSPAAPSTSAAVPAIRSVDLRNFTYPTSLCGFIDGPASTITLVDGATELDHGNGANDVVRLEGDVSIGDATGDGLDDAVAQILCAPSGMDGIVPAIVVVSVADGTPRVVTVLHGSGTARSQTVTLEGGVPYDYLPLDIVEHIGFADGHLVVRWRQIASGHEEVDGRRVTVTYRWNGSSLDVAGEADVEIVPGNRSGGGPTTMTPTTSTPTTSPVAPESLVMSFDFRSLVVTLEQSALVPARSPCREQFDGDRPESFSMVDGKADVIGEDGQVVGHISIESVNVVDLEGDRIMEAVVIFACESGGRRLRTAAIYAEEDGQLKMEQELLPTVPDTAPLIDVAGEPGQECTLGISWDWQGEVSYERRQYYRLTSDGMVPDTFENCHMPSWEERVHPKG